MFHKKFSEAQVLEFQSGDWIFKEGDEGRDMFIVLAGEIEILRVRAQDEHVLGILKRGDFLGEMSLLESVPRSASARAKGFVRLLVIPPGGFLLKIRRDPTFAFELLQSLSGRIRETNDRLLALLEEEHVQKEELKRLLDKTT